MVQHQNQSQPNPTQVRNHQMYPVLGHQGYLSCVRARVNGVLTGCHVPRGAREVCRDGEGAGGTGGGVGVDRSCVGGGRRGLQRRVRGCRSDVRENAQGNLRTLEEPADLGADVVARAPQAALEHFIVNLRARKGIEFSLQPGSRVGVLHCISPPAIGTAKKSFNRTLGLT